MPTDKEIAALVEALERAAADFAQIGSQNPSPSQSPDKVHEYYLRTVLIGLAKDGETRARAALAALTTHSDRASGQGDGWQSIETAPHAMHVLACRFDDAAGEWVSAVVLSPPIYPFTHWRPLPAPPSDVEPGEQERAQ